MVETTKRPPLASLPLPPKNPLPYWQRLKAARALATGPELLRDAGAKSRQDVFADIGLGKRLAAVVARKLLSASEETQPEGKSGPIVIRGSEGMAVKFAKC